MKKSLILLTILFFYILNCSAQTYGMKLGVNNSKLRSDQEIEGAKSRLGGNLSFFFNFNLLEDKFDFETGIEYNTKGYSRLFDVEFPGTIIAPEPTLVTFKTKSTTHYISIPVLLRYSREMKYGIKTFFSGGIYSAVGLIESINSNGFIYEGWGYRRFEIGGSINGGIEINRLLLEVGYDFGLTNLQKGNYGKLKNTTIQFAVGYYISK